MANIYQTPESINELGGTVSVAALTVLKAWTNLGSYYHTLLFVVQNTDATNATTVTIETSEDGVYPDANVLYTVNVPAQKQGSIEIGPGIIRRYWRVSAVTAGPTVALKWAVRGISRA